MILDLSVLDGVGGCTAFKTLEVRDGVLYLDGTLVGKVDPVATDHVLLGLAGGDKTLFQALQAWVANHPTVFRRLLNQKITEIASKKLLA